MESATITNSNTNDKLKRPLGVWLLTTYAGFITGVVPAAVAIYMLLLIAGNGGTGSDIVLELILSIALSIGIIISAVGAWRGNNNARRVLLILVTIYYVGTAINNYMFLSSGESPPGSDARLLGRVIRGFIYPALFIWYFNRSKTKRFYQAKVVTAPSADNTL